MFVVTFTSWKQRIDMCYKQVIDLLTNSKIPDRIYLNLSADEFHRMLLDLPDNLVGLLGQVLNRA